MPCNICRRYYDGTACIPKNLPCGHTYCADCLKTIISAIEEESDAPKTSIKCPACAATHLTLVDSLSTVFDLIDDTPNDAELEEVPLGSRPEGTFEELIDVIVSPPDIEQFAMKMLKPSMALSEFRQTVAARLGVSVETQYLYYKGELMTDDEKTLEEYEIKDKSVLFAITRFVGGMRAC